MAAGSCSKIAAGIASICLDASVQGGVNSLMYIANFDDIASFTQDGTTKAINTIVMESGKLFYRFVSLPEKHSVKYTSNDATANYSPWDIELNGVFYTKTTLSNEKLDDLKDGGRYVVVIQRNGGYMECLGIDVNAGTVSDPEGGLVWRGAEGGSGVMKTDDTGWKIKLGGKCSHIPKQFLPTTGTLVSAIAAMETLST